MLKRNLPRVTYHRVISNMRKMFGVAGSPAHALGVLQKGDELLMVDGHKVRKREGERVRARARAIDVFI